MPLDDLPSGLRSSLMVDPEGRVISGTLGAAAWWPDGQTLSANQTNLMLRVRADAPGDPLGVADPLRFHVSYGTDPGFDGRFQLAVRQASVAAFFAKADAPIVTAGETAMRWASIDVPAGARPRDLWFEPIVLFEQPIAGPVLLGNTRAENLNRDSGVAYSTLLAQGGLSARHAASSLLQMTDEALVQWVRGVTRLQNDEPMLMLQILHGGNDRNDDAPSLGPAQLPSSTPGGFQDNLSIIVGEVSHAWIQAGFNPDNLTFVVGPYHPQPGFVEQLEAFEEAAMELADAVENLVVVRGSRLITTDEMTANGFYDPRGEAHLSDAGFEALARLGLEAMISAGLPQTLAGDINGDGFVGAADLDLLLASWNQVAGAGSPLNLDADPDGFIGAGDLDILLGSWNTGIVPSPGVVVPEPSIFLTVWLVSSGLALRRSRGQCR